LLLGRFLFCAAALATGAAIALILAALAGRDALLAVFAAGSATAGCETGGGGQKKGCKHHSCQKLIYHFTPPYCKTIFKTLNPKIQILNKPKT
jgi:hypothetical protein